MDRVEATAAEKVPRRVVVTAVDSAAVKIAVAVAHSDSERTKEVVMAEKEVVHMQNWPDRAAELAHTPRHAKAFQYKIGMITKIGSHLF